jgi:hypothetical protein
LPEDHRQLSLKAKTAGLGSNKRSSGFRLSRANVLYTAALKALTRSVLDEDFSGSLDMQKNEKLDILFCTLKALEA